MYVPLHRVKLEGSCIYSKAPKVKKAVYLWIMNVYLKSREFPGGPVLGIHLAMQGIWVWSLVGER